MDEIRLFSFEQVGWVGFSGRNRVGLSGVHDGAPSSLILLRLHGVQPFTKPGLLRPLPVLPALRHSVWLFHGNPVRLGEQSTDQPQADTSKVIPGILTLGNRRMTLEQRAVLAPPVRLIYICVSALGGIITTWREASLAGRHAIVQADNGYRANRYRHEQGISKRH